MLIESVELTNIKSYAEQGCKIEFKPGVNLIWGDNGSGKTTILEAIGHCLFDSLDYNLNQFIREGTSDGQAVLTFLHSDGRKYAVVRDLKISAGLKIRDVASGRSLFTRRKDAEDWLSDQLGVVFGKYGKELFRNAIGVAQGKMTGSFMETEAVRKKIFDPILRVEEYNQAFKNLASTQKYLDGLIKDAQINQSRIRGRLERLPGLEEAIQALDAQVSAGTRQLIESREQLTTLRAELDSLDQILEEKKKFEQQLLIASQNLADLNLRMQTADKEFRESQQASETVQACEQGYQLHVQASEQLRELENRRVERDRVAGLVQRTEVTLSGIEQQLGKLRQSLAEITQAEKKISELTPDVKRQADLEDQKKQAEGRLAERQRLSTRITELQERMRDAEDNLAEIQEKLKSRAELEGKLAEQNQARQQLSSQIQDLSGSLDSKRKNREEVHAQFQKAILDKQALELAGQQQAQITAEIQKEEQELSQCVSLIEERNSLSLEKTSFDTELEAHQANLSGAQTEQGRSELKLGELAERLDLLKREGASACPVCRRPLGEHESQEIELEFENEKALWLVKLESAESSQASEREHIKRIQQRTKRIQTRLNNLPPVSRLDELRKAIADKHQQMVSVELRMEQLADAPQLVEQWELVLEHLSVELQDLSQAHDRLQIGRERCDQEIDQLNRKIHSLPHPSRAAELDTEIQGLRASLAKTENSLVNYAQVDQEIAALQAELERLGDPRTETSRCQGIANRRAAVEKDLQNAASDQRACMKEKDDLLQILLVYANLNGEIEQAAGVIRQNEPAYQDYLANLRLAQALSDRRAELERLSEQEKEAKSSVLELENQLHRVRQAYDPTHHQTVRLGFEAVRSSILTLETQISEWTNQKQHAVQEREELKIQEQNLASLEKELQRLAKLDAVLKFIRGSIKSASPEIVRKRVRVISQSADRIFQEVLGDLMLTLTWDEKYAIKIQSGGQVRVFEQLSGGEQMAASIAVRLSLLLHMSSGNLRWLFLDEPTANMDDKRRDRLADRITQLEQLDQIFVITHDDAFQRESHHVIQVTKQDDNSIVTIGN